MGNKEENEQIHQEKKYQFIREQVRPEKRKELLAVCRKLGILAVAAVIFGGIAGAVFLTVKDRFDKPSVKETRLNRSTATPDVTPAVLEQRKIPSGNEGMTLSEYSHLSEELAEVGNSLEDSLVGVCRKENSTSSWQGSSEGKRLFFGLIFQETKQYYYILTVCDNIREHTMVQVTMKDASIADGRIVGSDYTLNLAVVSVKKKNLSKNLQEQIRVSEFYRKTQVVNGSRVVAVGCPNGILNSVMTGSICNDDIAVSVVDNELRVYSTDIPFSEQSNGVVLDEKGRVIGILTKEFLEYTGRGGLAFVDIASVQKAIDFLRRGKSVPYMGIVAETIKESVAQAHGLPQGVYVSDIYSKSPAYQAGMRVADVITQIDGEEIHSMEEIYQRLVQHNRKEALVCTVVRTSGKKQLKKKIKVILG